MATSNEAIVLELIGVDKTKKEYDSANKSNERYRKTLGSVQKQLKLKEAALTMTADKLERYKALLNGASKEELRQIKALQASIKAKEAATKSMKGVNQQLRFMRGGFGQVGHQIQDVAVQAQMGTNAFVILGQQGSQIASLFGPGGALIGALLAVGAAIAVGLSGDVKKGTEAMDDLADHIEGLIEQGKELEQVYKDALGAIFRARIADFQTKLEDAQESLEDAKRAVLIADGSLVDLSSAALIAGDAIGAMAAAQQSTSEVTQEQSDAVLLAQGNVQKFKDEIAKLQSQLERLAAGKDPFEDLDEKAADLREFIEELQEEAATLGFSERALALREAAALGAAEADMAMINALFDKIEAYEREAEAVKKLAEEEEKRRKAALDQDFDDQVKVFDKLEALEDSFKTEIEMIRQQEAEKLALVKEAQEMGLLNAQQAAALRLKIQQEADRAIIQSAILTVQSLMNATRSQIDTLRGFLEEGSAVGKAFFVMSQAIAAADAVIKGFQQAAAIRVAYTNMAVMAGPGAPAVIAAGEAHAAMAIGMGMATAAAIAGQTLASFEGGGITFNGVRSGGLDGKGGRMAVVHPNEKITDLEKQGMGGGSVNINFSIQANDAAGFDELLVKRRALIVNMVNKAVNNSGRRSLT